METSASEQYLATLHTLIENYARGYSLRVYLFGSRARNDARSTSDIDIAIMLLSPVPENFFIQLQELIENSTIPYTVDLVDLREVEKTFYDKVLQEGKLWIS